MSIPGHLRWTSSILSIGLTTAPVAAADPVPPAASVAPAASAAPAQPAGPAVPDTPAASDVAPGPSEPPISWRLPKTTLKVAVSYQLLRCEDVRDSDFVPSPVTHKDAQLDVKVAATLAPVTEADGQLGPSYADGLVRVDPATLRSFWQDRNITTKTYANSHILQSIGSSPVDQTATVAGNIITGVVKIAAAAFGVPAAASAPGQAPPSHNPVLCGDDIKTELAQIDQAKSEVKKAKTDAQAKNAAAHLAALTAALTVTPDPYRVDPGETVIELPNVFNVPEQRHTLSADGLVAEISFDQQSLVKEKWIRDPGDASLHLALPSIRINLDFNKASPSLNDAKKDGVWHVRRDLPPNSFFRDAVYIPVTMTQYNGTQPHIIGQPQVIAFAQFGEARALPLKPKIFQNLSWSFAFAEDGEITDSSYGSKSTGATATGLLAGAAGGAASAATEHRNSLSASDDATLSRMGQTAKEKALTDAVTQDQLYQQMMAQGLITDDTVTLPKP